MITEKVPADYGALSLFLISEIYAGTVKKNDLKRQD